MSRYLVLVMTNIAGVVIKEFKIPIVFYFAALDMEGSIKVNFFLVIA